MKYVVIEERLMEPLRKKWKDAKYYIANINPECWFYIRHEDQLIVFNLTSLLTWVFNSRRALTLLRTQSHNIDIEVALWHQNQPNAKECNVCKEGLVEDEYHLLFTCFAYSAIHENYDDILRGGDDILKLTPRRLSSYAYALFTHRDLVLRSINIPS